MPILARQLSLDLRARTHGGARPGAGRPKKKPADCVTPHQTRPTHRKGDPVHVTLRLKRRLPSLRSELLRNVVKGALTSQRAKLEREGAVHFQVVHFSIQDDHMHLIVEAPDKRGIWRGIVGLEARISIRINRVLGRKGRLWGDRYHRHDLRSPIEVRNAVRYVLLNFQKHHRIIGDRSFADPQSSAPTFDGFARPPWLLYDLPPRDAVPLPVAAPDWPKVTTRTWLLGAGWRQHGLIDPAATPRASPFTKRDGAS